MSGDGFLKYFLSSVLRDCKRNMMSYREQLLFFYFLIFFDTLVLRTRKGTNVKQNSESKIK